MNDQSNNQNRSSNNQRRHHHKRRHHHNRAPSDQTNQPTNQSQATAPGNQGQNQGQSNNRRRFHKPHHNRPRPNQSQSNHPQQSQTINIERIYEKYLNLLDQHLIARRKYHDLFYRAEGAQKAKLEKNFYHSLNELKDFKEKMAPSARELFEKRNNGLNLDLTYTTNHELPAIADAVSVDGEWEDPHYLQSQKNADYANDTEESAGTMDDYLRYKNQH